MYPLVSVLAIIIGILLFVLAGKIGTKKSADISIKIIGFIMIISGLVMLYFVLSRKLVLPLSKDYQEENTSEAEIPAIQEESFQTEMPENSSENVVYTDVSQGGPYGQISISLPDGWSYELCPIDSDSLVNGMYGIHFYPNDVTNGYIEVSYIDSFGVCGTGLEEESATIAGMSANIGTYDNHEYWDFIAFDGDYVGMVAYTYNVDDWWSEYSGQVIDILDTLMFDQNVKEGGAYVYNDESWINEIELHFSLKNISSTGATLVFNQHNADAPKGELQYGEDFVIEMLRNGEWEEVPIPIEGNYGFNDIAIMLPCGEISEREIDWEWLYGELEPGEYRIGKSVIDFIESGKYDEYMVYAHFILKKNAEPIIAEVDWSDYFDGINGAAVIYDPIEKCYQIHNKDVSGAMAREIAIEIVDAVVR